MNTPAVRASQLPPPPEAFRLRDAAWHRASIEQALRHWDGRSDLWVFGYGSLIWRPEFDHLEARRARIHGYHRALCLWSRINRGTPERPGLVFGLDLGGVWKRSRNVWKRSRNASTRSNTGCRRSKNT